MTKHKKISQLIDSGLIAVIRQPKEDDIHHIADALIKGGVGALEITVDTPGAFRMIENIKQTFGDQALVGAGTVLDAATAKRAIEARADFVFSPSFNKEMVDLTNRYGAISIPGVLTPTEMVTAYESGADLVKVFPATSFGPGYIKDLQGPLGHIPMIPTGGVTSENVGIFMENGAAAVGAGGSLLDKKAIQAKDFETLTNKAIEFRGSIKGARKESE
ncbi:bifunctional 4-hydroxy-2-oxoglutarate aldolase/2-dehydro-3-deoxy-phosphogluconate aldolase [Pontibacillus yanchengensis]|uniref:Bifunctional 4-hydroxy-2-oxoglutarate aldolase/2-dehydro-3-deoxy-phosphogluconate aldolase n=2 Tax=Pontibacillus yanchengensis TaxID=462910 RepID=A0ACC7VB84_9BACI|nr:bifunctional 4-hydroxy-2-oxoglutarate aldolase/2-dehydro-3-deoxy-phosphogluconate aldolase [Pontibacillus yanchengensis]MYL32040.1 bifunctional 4-hydroxy-2-oxoglutarate aldolase/2-dehydro-3-deoxy-phosphogluconate aldolase [Pontibacillus yanchengensis]MYL52618.1 bifunctional 4-hydroxy-2-oxoglutarate aldolase/2-dehydro-3-deoxy-phosphogluconate aldolase [Pontibacillus yanchengensis]